MKIFRKITLAVCVLSILLVAVIVPASAYGGSEVRTDISSGVTTYRINTPRIAIGFNQPANDNGQYQSPAGHFIDNGVAWHNDRDYYGNGSIAVTNYRDNPDTVYRLPYLYNYHYALKSDTLLYTLPQYYNWLRVHFDTYYGHSRNNDEYIDLIGSKNTIIVVYYNYKTLAYDAESNTTVEVEHHEEISVMGTTQKIPMCPPTITEEQTAYDLTITTWSAEYSQIRIGTSFDNTEAITELTQRESNRLFDKYKSEYNPAPAFESFWVSLWNSVDAFLSIEFFPGFNIGIIIYVMLGVALLGIILKYFAGG